MYVFIHAYIHISNSDAAAKHWLVRWGFRAIYANENDKDP
jgi:hypothetical protein